MAKPVSFTAMKPSLDVMGVNVSYHENTQTYIVSILRNRPTDDLDSVLSEVWYRRVGDEKWANSNGELATEHMNELLDHAALVNRDFAHAIFG